MTGTAWTDAAVRPRRGPAADPRADGELLRLFAAGRDEAAFAALVRRHGSLVWGVAVRHAADRHAAEDAFQATFFALAREATRLRTDSPLAGWLHTVARRLAGRTRRKNTLPLGETPGATADPLAALSARELLVALDAEIDRLPDRYRLPLILCGLDGLTRDEAAERLGWPVGSVKGRLERGRDVLRVRLAKRGIELPGVWAAAVGAVVPAVLLTSTPTLALDYAATGRGGAAAALAATLGRGAGRMWAAGLVLCAAVIAGTGYGSAGGAVPEQTPPAPAAAEVAPDPDADWDTVPVLVRYNGKPAAGVTVWAYPVQDFSSYFFAQGGGAKPIPAPTAVVSGPDGVARMPAESVGEKPFALFARDPAGRVGGWNESRLRDKNQRHTVDLRDAAAFTGRVTGPDGTPLAGVRVTALSFSEKVAAEHYSVRFDPPPWEPPAASCTTDADGRFSVPGFPAGMAASVAVRADGYGQQTLFVPKIEPSALVLERAGAVRFTVRGAAAESVTGLEFRMQGQRPGPAPKSKYHCYHTGTFPGTAAYEYANLMPGEYTFDAAGGGAIPVAVKAAQFTVTPGETVEVVLDLTPLPAVTGRVVDVSGTPVAGVKVRTRPADVTEPPFPGAPAVTGADGRFAYHAPPGQAVVTELAETPERYLGPAYTPNRPEAKLTAAGHEFADIKLRPAGRFTATVVDAAGKPTPAEVYRSDVHFGDTARTRKDGTVRFDRLDPEDMIALRARRGDAVNVPTAVEIGADGTQKITVSKANAAVIAGRIVGPAGNPVAGAAVGLHWQTRGVGKAADTGRSTVLERLTSDADGRYRSTALWPTDEYWVVVDAPGFAKAESAHIRNAESKPHTVDVTLVPTNLAVSGRVVDLAGRPVAGATVFNRGDGDKPMETTADAAGAFTLRGYRPGPGFVFAQKAGHRTAVAPADPGGAAVTIVLRTDAEPPVPLPDTAAHTAAVNALTDRTADFLWANRETLGGFTANLFDDLAPYDPAKAKAWAAAEPRFAARLKQAGASDALFAVAKTDPDAALEQLAERKGRDGFYAALGLAKRLRPTHPKQALRVLEDAVQRARATDMPEKVHRLTETGYWAARCGNKDAGRALVLEAVALAEPLGVNDRTGFYRGWAVASLAPFDRDRTVALLEAHSAERDYGRYLAQAVDRLAAFDPEAAVPLLDKFQRSYTFDEYEGRMFLAYRFAATDPDRALKILAGVTYDNYRTHGYLKLAELVGRTDRPRAWRILDAVLAEYDGEPPLHDSDTGSGGRAALLAVAAVTARDLGYPNASAFVTRALAVRPTADRRDPKDRAEQTVRIALALSFTDPAAARRVLAGAVPPGELLKRAAAGNRDALFVAAFVTPEAAFPAVEALVPLFNTGQSGLIELFDGLSAKDRLRAVARWTNLPRVNTEWEE